MEQNHIATLSDICRTPVVISADEPVHVLIELFQQNPDVPVVPVIGEEGYLDCVSRNGLLNLMTRPFVREIYGKKSVRSLLEVLQGAAVVMEPATDLNAAAIQLLSLDPTLQTSAFPLVRDGACVGTVAVSDLMLAVAEDQKRLLRELDLMSSRLRDEVALGVKIQQDLLPQAHQTINGVVVAGGITTSSEIGGDFFDYFAIGDGRVGLVIADVSGHGVQAGMVTTAAKASLHTLLAMGVSTPAGLLSGMNNAILQTARQSLLMTCLIACIDTTNNTLTVADAGHNFPYIVRCESGRPELLDTAAGFPLGFERDTSYPESCTRFSAGDGLFLYTDGLIECTSRDGEELGYERFALLLEEAMENFPPHQMHDAILRRASLFTGTGLFEDDVTTLFAVRSPAGSTLGQRQ